MFEKWFKDPTHEFLHLVRAMENKYKQDYRLLRNLEGDLELYQYKNKRNFYTALALTWGAIWYNESSKNPLPTIRKFGLFFGTHRSFRLYLYSCSIIYASCWIPYNIKVRKTMDKIKDTDAIRSSIRYNNYIIDGPQQLDFASSKIMPWKSMN